MRNVVLLLIGIILLFLVSSLMLQAIYGQSYGFLQGEDRWVPDGSGGWTRHGHPTAPEPDVPSVEVPLAVRYIPIFLPALLLILFMFTPLRKHVETRSPEPEADSPETTNENNTPAT